MYLMQASIAKGIVNEIEDEILSKLWHQRLNHINEKRVWLFAEDESLTQSEKSKVRGVNITIGLV